jgi:hypothetical protein
MELLLWLEQVEIWRLQRKEQEAMANDKITGDPKQPTVMYEDTNVLGMYDWATEEYTRAMTSGDTREIRHWTQELPKWYQNEIATRAIDDAKHGKRR